MQFSQPFCGTRYPINPNYPPCWPYNYTQQYQTMYPEIIDEGEVVSVVLPDGTVHFYFLPVNKYPTNYQYMPNDPNRSSYWNNNVGAYFIKSISNPISQTAFIQQYQNMLVTPYSRPFLFSDCNSTNMSGFQLKFHNDCWTSTTDLHYFFPHARGSNWFPAIPLKASEAIQTDTPIEYSICQQALCCKPCLCSRAQKENQRRSDVSMVEDCLCYKHDNNSRTSVSSDLNKKSKIKILNRKSNVKPNRYTQAKLEKKTSNVNCGCHKPSTTDKAVTTYTDQASNCHAEGRETQTSNCDKSSAGSKVRINLGDIKTELWLPKATIKSSEEIIGMYQTDCSSESCCCSAADMNRRDM